MGWIIKELVWKKHEYGYFSSTPICLCTCIRLDNQGKKWNVFIYPSRNILGNTISTKHDTSFIYKSLWHAKVYCQAEYNHIAKEIIKKITE